MAAAAGTGPNAAWLDRLAAHLATLPRGTWLTFVQLGSAVPREDATAKMQGLVATDARFATRDLGTHGASASLASSSNAFRPATRHDPVASTAPWLPDWTCGSCRGNNHGSKKLTRCFHCGAPRGTAAAVAYTGRQPAAPAPSAADAADVGGGGGGDDNDDEDDHNDALGALASNACQICTLQIKGPVSCDTCLSFFCKSCLSTWAEAQAKKELAPTCPICRAALSQAAVSTEWATVRSKRQAGPGSGGGGGEGGGNGGASQLEDKDSSGRTELARAVSRDNIAAVEELLKHGADPRTADNNGETPLHYAARGGFDDVAMRLLEAGAIPDALNARQHTPLDHISLARYEATMPRTYKALRTGAFAKNKGGAVQATSISRGFAMADAVAHDVRHVRPPPFAWLQPAFQHDRICMSWPLPSAACRGMSCLMVHDRRIVPKEWGGTLPAYPALHVFGDQRDEDMRHPMRLHVPEGRGNLLRTVCTEFEQSKTCRYGDWCKFLHLGRKTSALNWGLIDGLTAHEAQSEVFRAASQPRVEAEVPPPPYAQPISHAALSKSTRTIMLRNLPFNLSESNVKAAFADVGLSVATVRLQPYPKRFAHVEFVDTRNAAAAYALQGEFRLEGRVITMEYSVTSDEGRSGGCFACGEPGHRSPDCPDKVAHSTVPHVPYVTAPAYAAPVPAPWVPAPAPVLSAYSAPAPLLPAYAPPSPAQRVPAPAPAPVPAPEPSSYPRAQPQLRAPAADDQWEDPMTLERDAEGRLHALVLDRMLQPPEAMTRVADEAGLDRGMLPLAALASDPQVQAAVADLVRVRQSGEGGSLARTFLASVSGMSFIERVGTAVRLSW